MAGKKLGALLVAFLSLAAVLSPAAGTGPAAAADLPESAVAIRVLSNRADLISGGDALVELVAPSTSGLRVDLNGRKITSSFARRPAMGGRIVGLVKGMRNGTNVFTARAGGHGARLTITNHPIGGPVFSGPQIQPWACLPGARDKQCNRPAVYTYAYKPAVPLDCLWLLGNINGCTFQSYDPDDPPSPESIAQTTTDQGVTVPYIVRVETGTINRDQYRIGAIFDPTKKWEPWAPQKSWNRKLVIRGGAGCGIGYSEADAGDVLQDTALSRGFAVMGHALANAGHNCNVATEAESLMMTKERLIEQYGEIRYTVGTGCSGGAELQYQVANAYPGIYQGINPACSYPDGWTTRPQQVDFALITKYYTNPAGWAPGVVWAPTDQTAVNGNPNPATSGSNALFDPTGGGSCPGVSAQRVYDAQTNPRGVRCTFQDYMVSVFGRRPRNAWGLVEKKIGRGFANRPLDNVGIQYGLRPLMAGKITPAQFVDLNAKIGSYDIDANWKPTRMLADPASLPIAYRGGPVNTANNLERVAIVDNRGPTDLPGGHETYRTYALRARLDREIGSHDNQVLWRAPVPIMGDIRFENEAILAMDEWLAAVEADKRSTSLARKIVANKPKSLVDRCTNGMGTALPANACDVLLDVYTTPRIEAGMPFTDDVMKCRLEPLRRSDYFPIVLTDGQWSSLRKTFGAGVCDYTKPGVGYQKTVPWMTYKAGAGGRPLGPAPMSSLYRSRS